MNANATPGRVSPLSDSAAAYGRVLEARAHQADAGDAGERGGTLDTRQTWAAPRRAEGLALTEQVAQWRRRYDEQRAAVARLTAEVQRLRRALAALTGEEPT